MGSKRALALALACAAAVPAAGATLGEGALTLAECRRLAREASPSVEASRQRVRQAREAIGKAWAAMLPAAKFSAAWTPLGHDEVSVLNDSLRYEENTRNQTLSASWNLFNLGRDAQSLGIARRARTSSEEALREARFELTAAVTRAYYTILSAGRTVSVREGDLKVSRDNLKLTQALYTEGIVGYPEVLNARLQVQSSRKSVIRAQTAIASARLALNILLEREPLGPLTLAEPDGDPGVAGELESHFAAAFAQRPDWRRSALSVATARARESLALLDVFPNLTLDAAWSSNLDRPASAPNPNWSLDLALTVPLFDGFSDYRDWRTAQAASEIARQERRDLERKVRREVATAWLNYKRNQELLEVVQEETAAAQERLKLITDLFKEGRSSSEFLQNAQDRLLSSRTEMIELDYNARVLRTELAIAVGDEAAQ